MKCARITNQVVAYIVLIFSPFTHLLLLLITSHNDKYLKSQLNDKIPISLSILCCPSQYINNQPLCIFLLPSLSFFPLLSFLLIVEIDTTNRSKASEFSRIFFLILLSVDILRLLISRHFIKLSANFMIEIVISNPP